jgi:hydroxymethylglutaryl-CoA lyase
MSYNHPSSQTERIIFTECPRDAMQGWKRHIPTAEKVAYLNQLLKVGFDVLDFGSFVSAKAIPQLADTKDVLPLLNLTDSITRLLAIVANTRGAEEASQYNEIEYIGFPFSISETFQLRNTNKTIGQSLVQVQEIQNICLQKGKKLVIYISMGFGNPYGDPYNSETAIEWVDKLATLGVSIIAMSDTVGMATPDNINYIFRNLIPAFPKLQIGAHFHTTPHQWKEKVDAAWGAGCRRFDTALRGIGGCPMAEDKLVGNMATENVIGWCMDNGLPLPINQQEFQRAMAMAGSIFHTH